MTFFTYRVRLHCPFHSKSCHWRHCRCYKTGITLGGGALLRKKDTKKAQKATKLANSQPICRNVYTFETVVFDSIVSVRRWRTCEGVYDWRKWCCCSNQCSRWGQAHGLARNIIAHQHLLCPKTKLINSTESSKLLSIVCNLLGRRRNNNSTNYNLNVKCMFIHSCRACDQFDMSLSSRRDWYIEQPTARADLHHNNREMQSQSTNRATSGKAANIHAGISSHHLLRNVNYNLNPFDRLVCQDFVCRRRRCNCFNRISVDVVGKPASTIKTILVFPSPLLVNIHRRLLPSFLIQWQHSCGYGWD